MKEGFWDFEVELAIVTWNRQDLVLPAPEISGNLLETLSLEVSGNLLETLACPVLDTGTLEVSEEYESLQAEHSS